MSCGRNIDHKCDCLAVSHFLISPHLALAAESI